MRILLTAFEPYDQWETNSSWEALVAYVSVRGANPSVVTRKYPVDLHKLLSRIETDLALGFDAVLHLGQSPGLSAIKCETIAVNVAGDQPSPVGLFGPLVENAPIAYRTNYPVGDWIRALDSIPIPAKVSYHAGTYLCNAAMYLSHHWYTRRQEKPWVGLLHLPLTPEQASRHGYGAACMSSQQSSQAIARIIDEILRLEMGKENQYA